MIPYSLKAEGPLDNSANVSGNEEVISLSDIVPETNICFVSLMTRSTAVTKFVIGIVYYFPTLRVFFFTVKQNKESAKESLDNCGDSPPSSLGPLLHFFCSSGPVCKRSLD